MSLVPAKCTQCDASLEVDSTKEAAICPHCFTPFITEKAINHYVNNNTYTTNINATNLYITDPRDFIIVAGELREYRGESAEVVIPDNVTKIGRKKCVIKGKKGEVDMHVFYDFNISSLTVPSSMTRIDHNDFCNIDSLTKVVLSEGVEYIGQGAFSESPSLEEVTFPSTLTTLDSSSFWKCPKLSTVELKEGFTTLRDHAFADCTSLSSVTLPETVTEIGHHAFSYNKSLTSINLPQGAEIGNSVFEHCDSLESVTLPDATKFIQPSTFLCCSNLKSVAFGNSVTSIGAWAFCGCIKLENITIPRTVTFIGSSAFQNCHGLTSVVVPESVNNIATKAFCRCLNLKSLTICGEKTAIAQDIIESCENLETLWVHKKNKKAAKQALLHRKLNYQKENEKSLRSGGARIRFTNTKLKVIK